MRISFIDNGLDSLKKGYGFLKEYEEIKESKEFDNARFFLLKDTILSIQHGIEILFKFILSQNNELLLFTSIDDNLKKAFNKRRAGEIAELYEADGVHTVTYKESIVRVSDICGFLVDERLKKKLLKIESWRNAITHSAVVLNENEVSSVLSNILHDLDCFFGPILGSAYLEGQGKQDLNRAYSLFKSVHGKHQRPIKDKVIERLISSINKNSIKNVSTPGSFIVRDIKKSLSILQEMQGDGVKYGCDMVNGHCSGSSYIEDLNSQGEVTLRSEDNNASYIFKLDSILIYIPEINNNISPIIFLYSSEMNTLGNNPELSNHKNFITQEGLFIEDSEEYLWEKDEINNFFIQMNQEDEIFRKTKGIFRFISKGCFCFLNVQMLEYGRISGLISNRQIDDIDELYKLLDK